MNECTFLKERTFSLSAFDLPNLKPLVLVAAVAFWGLQKCWFDHFGYKKSF